MYSLVRTKKSRQCSRCACTHATHSTPQINSEKWTRKFSAQFPDQFSEHNRLDGLTHSHGNRRHKRGSVRVRPAVAFTILELTAEGGEVDCGQCDVLRQSVHSVSLGLSSNDVAGSNSRGGGGVVPSCSHDVIIWPLLQNHRRSRATATDRQTDGATFNGLKMRNERSFVDLDLDLEEVRSLICVDEEARRL